MLDHNSHAHARARAKPAVLPVETSCLVTVSEFEHYMRPGGVPLVIKGWMNNWRALSAWDWEFFRSTYGDDQLSLGYTSDGGDGVVSASMRDYIDYILGCNPASPIKCMEEQLQLSRPMYCLSYKPFGSHPELWNDFTIPPFVANWWPFFSESFREAHFPQNQGWVLIGGRSAVAPFHQDSHHTLTWLAQLRGRKECYLVSPDDSKALYNGQVDPANPDLDRYPLFNEAAVFHCVLEPGEMLFLPPDWWHHVITLENSITISCNFINHLNFGYYLRRAFRERLPEVLSMLPARLPPDVAKT